MNRNAKNPQQSLRRAAVGTLILCFVSGAAACSGTTVRTQPTSVHRNAVGLSATDDLWVRHDERTTAGQLEIVNPSQTRADLWMPAPYTPAPTPEDEPEAPRLDAFLGKVTANRL